jgi:hypothetical protein
MLNFSFTTLMAKIMVAIEEALTFLGWPLQRHCQFK